MKYEVKAYSVGGILDKSLSIYFGNFFTFALIGLVMSALMLLGFIAINKGLHAVAASKAVSENSDLVVYFFFDFLVSICSALVARMFVAKYLYDKQIPFKIGLVFTLLPAIVACTLLQILATLCGWFLLVVPGIIVGAGLSCGPIIAAFEGLGPIQSLKRSWRLTAGSKGKIFGLSLLVVVIPLLLAFPLGMSCTFLPRPLIAIWTFILAGLTMPYASIVFTLLYFKLRVEKEAFDLEHLALNFGETPPGPDPTNPGASL